MRPVLRRIPAWRSSLRARYALVATLLAAMAFTAGGAIALRLYHESLVASVDNSALDTAGAIAAGARGGPLPNPIPMPVAAGVPRVQILDAAGKVLSGDPASVQDPPFRSSLFTGASTSVTDVTGSPYLPEHHAALIAVRTATAGGPVTVLVVQSLDEADARTSQAIELSSAAGALCLVTVAAVAWLAVGSTLRRVERLRAQVETVTASGDLSRRVQGAGRDELAGLGATLDEMLAALARSDERQRRFVADAAHELRTPIAGLHASIEVAGLHPNLPRDDKWLGELRDGHRRLGRLVDDLLVLASVDEHAPRHRTPVRLEGVLIDAAQRRTPPGLRIHFEATGRATILGDPTQLERIVANLVDNAVRHARSEVRLALVAEAADAVITVADDGAGIAPDDRDRIWVRFARLEDERSQLSAGLPGEHNGGGTGLGLALVKELVQVHGGTASVTDAESGGALFTVRLPLAGVVASPGRCAAPHLR